MSDDEWTPETWRERGDEHLARARHAIESGNTALALSDIHQAVEAHMKAAIMAFNGMNSWTAEFRGLRLDNHKLQTLAKRGGLSDKLNERARQSVEFRLRWRIVRDIVSDSRFRRNGPPRPRLEEILAAATDKPDGVITWLRTI